MKLAMLILFAFAAAAGQPFTLIGSIDRIAGSDITVKTPRGSFAIRLDDRTQIAKDQPSLKIGAEISVRCEQGTSGALRAVQVWAKIVSFSATVRYVEGDEIEVVTIPKADYPREEHRIVRLHADTAFSTTRKDLTAGQTIRVAGLDVGSGAVDAARITIYNTDMPVTR